MHRWQSGLCTSLPVETSLKEESSTKAGYNGSIPLRCSKNNLISYPNHVYAGLVHQLVLDTSNVWKPGQHRQPAPVSVEYMNGLKTALLTIRKYLVKLGNISNKYIYMILLFDVKFTKKVNRVYLNLTRIIIDKITE